MSRVESYWAGLESESKRFRVLSPGVGGSSPNPSLKEQSFPALVQVTFHDTMNDIIVILIPLQIIVSLLIIYSKFTQNERCTTLLLSRSPKVWDSSSGPVGLEFGSYKIGTWVRGLEFPSLLVVYTGSNARLYSSVEEWRLLVLNFIVICNIM